MKKILGLLTLILLITVTACDDGEMTVKSFNFTGLVNECGEVDNLYIKNNGSEVLLMNLSTHPLLNIASALDENGAPIPTVVSLPTGAVIYRNYSGSASGTIVCGTIDNPDTYVLEEWIGSGTIEIITTALPVTDSGLIQYSHSITFLDVSLTKGDETIRIQNTDFGAVETSLKIKFRLASTSEIPTQLSKCGDALYTYSSGDFVADRDALFLNFEEGTFDNIVDETTLELGDTNSLALYHYSGSIGTSVLCPTSPVVSPIVDEIWEAATGRIRIVKETDSSNVVHYNIYLYDDVVFYNISSSDVVAETFIPDPDPITGFYYLGQYTP